jgi:hypothetical protein
MTKLGNLTKTMALVVALFGPAALAAPVLEAGGPTSRQLACADLRDSRTNLEAYSHWRAEDVGSSDAGWLTGPTGIGPSLSGALRNLKRTDASEMSEMLSSAGLDYRSNRNSDGDLKVTKALAESGHVFEQACK